MMRSFGKRADVVGGRRRTRRQNVSLAAAAVALHGSRSVIVEDVCSTGARLRGRNLPSSGAQLVIRVGDSDLMASVAWAANDECGVTFDAPLDPKGVQKLKDDGQFGRVFGLV